MKLILLPGSSPRNKEWIEKVRDELGDLFDESLIMYYTHWNSNGNMDRQLEIENLSKIANIEDCVIFAKSAGIGVSLGAIKSKKINPTKCIFVGLPLSWKEKRSDELSPYYMGYKIPTLFIQQEHDPFTNYKELKGFLEKNKLTNYEIKEVEGNNHHYSNIKELKYYIKDFLK